MDRISLTLTLADELQKTFESSEIAHEAKQGLLGHNAAITEALQQVQKCIKQNESEGCEMALVEVHNQLCRIEVEVKGLKERGWWSQIGRSEDISPDLDRVQVGLSEALQALQVVLTHQQEGQPPVSSFSTKETGISGLYNDLKSTFSFAADVSADDDRPLASTLEFQRASIGDGDQGTAVNSSMQPDACQKPACPKLLFRYNRNCMEFLQKQMAEAKEALLAGRFTKVVKLDSTSEAEANATSYEKAFDHALNLGKTLTGRHAKAFDMHKFYTATEAREGAQAICKILKACLEWWKVEGVEILDRVPQEAVEEDEKTLDRYLGYILGMERGDYIFNDMHADIQKEWKQAKQEHEVQLRSLQIVPDQEIGLPQRQLSESVYVATYRGREHAVKSGNRMDNVGFARFYTEAAVMGRIHSLSVARLFAVTRSGKLVMEKGEMDIMTWFWQHKSQGLKLKLRLLHDAARSLNEVHYAKLVHRDICTKKFVVFGGGQPEVKLVGFGKAFATGNITGKNTVRKHGKITFAAPEIFEEKPCDLKSDIYSFGIVMYELIGETLPYGRGATDAKVMAMKRNGEPPSDIPPGKCPDGLLNLMAECCAVDPAARPSSMEEVQQRLTKLVDQQVDSVQKLHAMIDEIGTMLQNARYNVNMLAFLHACMTKAKNVYEIPKRPQDWKDLVGAIKDGMDLVARHTQEFNLRNYYTVDETLYLVNGCCTDILRSADQFEGNSASDTERSVPGSTAEKDRNFLEQHLGFVVRVLDHDSVKDGGFLEEWETARSRLEKQVRDVQRISRTDVDWKGKTKIAAGGEGTVYKTRWNGREVALKVPKDSESHHTMLAEFWAETALIAELKHEHVVPVLAMCGGVANSSGNDCTPFLVMELATENLGAWYKRQGLEAWALKRNVLLQAAKGLHHLHKHCVVHRDIKPENILIFPGGGDGCPIVKLCDLGVAVGQTAEWRRRTTKKWQPGTEEYKAPELFDGKRSSPESDVYSFGIVLIEVVANCEHHLYKGHSGRSAKLDGKLPCAIPDTCPADLKDLIQKCLDVNPDKRPCMEEVKEVLHRK